MQQVQQLVSVLISNLQQNHENSLFAPLHLYSLKKLQVTVLGCSSVKYHDILEAFCCEAAGHKIRLKISAPGHTNMESCALQELNLYFMFFVWIKQKQKDFGQLNRLK